MRLLHHSTLGLRVIKKRRSTSMIPAPTSRTDTSRVPPPRSKTRISSSSSFSNPALSEGSGLLLVRGVVPTIYWISQPRQDGEAQTRDAARKGQGAVFFLFFFTLVTCPRRSLSLELSDTRVYAPEIRARLRTLQVMHIESRV